MGLIFRDKARLQCPACGGTDEYSAAAVRPWPLAFVCKRCGARIAERGRIKAASILFVIALALAVAHLELLGLFQRRWPESGLYGVLGVAVIYAIALWLITRYLMRTLIRWDILRED